MDGPEPITIDEIVIGDPPEAWAAAGYTVDADGRCRVGTVRLRLVGPDGGRRIRSWRLRGLPADWSGDLEGIPTHRGTDPPCEPAAHPLGVLAIDHLVLISPDVDRTVATLAGIGLTPRRERRTDTYGAPMRQVFFRLGEVVLELIGPAEEPGEGDAAFFGLALTVDDLDAAASLLGPALGAVKDAVQPGRRIATMRHRDLGVSVATALMSPAPR